MDIQNSNQVVGEEIEDRECAVIVSRVCIAIYRELGSPSVFSHMKNHFVRKCEV